MLRYKESYLAIFFALIFAICLPLAQSFAIPDVTTVEMESGETQIEPESNEYVIKSGDTLTIIVKGYEEDYNKSVIVQPNGKIKYMSLDEIDAAGLTVPQLEGKIQEELQIYISNPQISISVMKEEDNTQEENSTQLDEQAQAEATSEVDKLLEKRVIKSEKAEIDINPPLIAPGDIIDIVVMEYSNYSRIVMVQSNGRIKYPPLGEIPAAGYTEKQLSQKITAGLSYYISNPQAQAAITGTVKFDTGDLGPEYSIKARDVVNITVTKHNNYNQTMVVQLNGLMFYQPLGQVQAAGLTTIQLTNSITAELLTRIGDSEIVIRVGQFTQIPDGIKVQTPTSMKKYGSDFFAGARDLILNLERDLAQTTGALPTSAVVRDAISGFVGPVDMMTGSVTATVPAKYVLAPGDKLTLKLWTDIVEPQNIPLIVNDMGEVDIPKIGKLVVRGMTLTQFENAAREELTREAYKNLKLIATLDKLRSIQIFISGEVFRPGSYAVSAVTTLFNALYMCGGPNENGSLRNIKLIRGSETKTVDFYKFLIDGDSAQDINLDAGDTILIPQSGNTVTIAGEVNRPARYELKEGEKLLELISLAGGIQSSGYLQRIKIDSVDPSVKRIAIDIDLSKPDQTNLPVFDGDIVTVFSIPSEQMNIVTVEGKVRIPGVYQLKQGMKISDLIKAARGLLGEAYKERADVLRLNPDKKTTELIPIVLSKALEGSGTDDIPLQQWDRLIVYSEWDVKWVAARVVSIHGAIQRPGSYERSDGMTIEDLLIKSGGTLPNAYLDRALLIRMDERGEETKGLSVNLRDSGKSIKLSDGDVLLVSTYREVEWQPERVVTISGATQNPGRFLRIDDMKVADLIHRAGGLIPEAYPDRALLLRLNERQQVAEGFIISPNLALQDDPKNNLTLKDGDELKIYTYDEAVWEPKRIVTIAGAVLSPNTFERLDNMKVSELVKMAGGLLPTAYIKRADISRLLPNSQTYEIIRVELSKIFSGDESADILLNDEDLLTIYTIKQVKYHPDNIVTIYGMVQQPGEYPRHTGMKLSDLIFISGGIVPGAHDSIEIARIRDGNIEMILVDIAAVIAGDEKQDILLQDEDLISIRQRKEYMDAVRSVKIEGEVKFPGRYMLGPKETLSTLIERAGGLTDRAYLWASVVTRNVDHLIMTEQRKSMQQVRRLFDSLRIQEYQREFAKAELERKRIEGEDAEDSSSTEKSIFANSATMPLVSGVQEATEMATIASIPTQTESAVSIIEDVARQRYTIVTPARKIDSFLPSGRLIVNLKKAMEEPGSADDIILEDEDMIMIPPTPASISISGAVMQPSSITYIPGKKIKYYIEMVGGYARDADKDAVYVIKANGLVIRGGKTKLLPGDVIVIPTKVIVQKVTDRLGQIIGVVKFAVTTAAMVYTIRLIVKEF